MTGSTIMQQTQQPQTPSAVDVLNAGMVESAASLQALAAVNNNSAVQVTAQLASHNTQTAQEYVRYATERRKEELQRRGISYTVEKVPVDDRSKPVWDKSKPVRDKEGNPVTDEAGNQVYEQAVTEDGKLMYEPQRDSFGRIRYNSVTRITGVPNHEQWLAAFFVDTTPCWFPECEEKRAKYKALLEDAAKAAGKDHCAPCQEGAVMRSMRDEVLPLILRAGPPYQPAMPKLLAFPPVNNTNHYNGTDTKTIPGAAAPSGPAATGSQPEGRRRSLLRRTLDRVAAYFGYSPNA